jgi:hypothetical protein
MKVLGVEKKWKAENNFFLLTVESTTGKIFYV